jgi:hypothetical protein
METLQRSLNEHNPTIKDKENFNDGQKMGSEYRVESIKELSEYSDRFSHAFDF